MLKKGFQILGIIAIICFSFFCTDKAVAVIKLQDEMMKEIMMQKDSYEIKSINAEFIFNHYVIPGYNGLKIDVDQSYTNMKRLGEFNEKLLIYKEYAPQISITNIYDRYVIKGNPEKNMVSLLFKIDDDDEIEELLLILKKANVRATFFLDGLWVSEKNEEVNKIIKEGHEVNNLGYDHKYSNDFFTWTNNKLKNKRQKPKYCYIEKEEQAILNLCQDYKMYTIIPSVIVGNYPYSEVKENLERGSIISFEVTETVLKELKMIINHIKSKGHKITPLSHHLSERRPEGSF